MKLYNIAVLRHRHLEKVPYYLCRKEMISVANKPNKIIIHHSATPDGLVLKDFDAIRRYHKETNGWRDIGYHWVIESVDNEYKILKGRDESDDGAHCIGQNTSSIGICMVGDFTKAEPPEAQYQTLVYLIREIYKRYGKLPIGSHKQYAATSCPGLLNLEKVAALVNGLPVVRTWRNVISEYADEVERWQRGIEVAVQLAKQDSDLGDLEIFEFLPELIMKIDRRGF